MDNTYFLLLYSIRYGGKRMVEETKYDELLLKAFIEDDYSSSKWDTRSDIVKSFKRYNDLVGSPYKEYLKMENVSNKGLPVLLGLTDKGDSYIVDLEDNPISHIVGGTGSCKDWLIYSLMYTLLTSNSPDDLQFIILDANQKPIWQKFSKSPHVLGYHNDIYKYVGILKELIEESKRRQEVLTVLGKHDWKTLRKELKDQENNNDLSKYPNLVVVLDELTHTMATLYNLDSSEKLDELREVLETLTSMLEGVGIHLITLGQRAFNPSIPTKVMEQATLKVSFQLNSEGDLRILYGKKLSNPKANTMYVKENGKEGLETINSLPICNVDLDQLHKQVMVIGLAWTRRIIGNGIDYTKVTEGMEDTLIKSFNRADTYRQSLMDMERGYILTNKERSIEVEPKEIVNSAKVSEPIKESIEVETLVKGKSDLLTRIKSLFSRNK